MSYIIYTTKAHKYNLDLALRIVFYHLMEADECLVAFVNLSTINISVLGRQRFTEKKVVLYVNTRWNTYTLTHKLNKKCGNVVRVAQLCVFET